MVHRENLPVRTPHRPGSRLADIILGGQDGLVNVLGVILGVAAASRSEKLVVAAGLAATFAESISMAAVAYTTTRAEEDHFQSERQREYQHIELAPELERDEIREIYAAKGFQGELLERIVETITANKDVWVAVMMSEEHRLAEIPQGQSLRSALVVGLSALAGSFVPLVPFFFLGMKAAVLCALAVAALTLFGFGAYKASVTVGHPTRAGIELALIGMVSALVGYAAGALFQVPTTP